MFSFDPTLAYPIFRLQSFEEWQSFHCASRKQINSFKLSFYSGSLFSFRHFGTLFSRESVSFYSFKISILTPSDSNNGTEIDGQPEKLVQSIHTYSGHLRKLKMKRLKQWNVCVVIVYNKQSVQIEGMQIIAKFIFMCLFRWSCCCRNKHIMKELQVVCVFQRKLKHYTSIQIHINSFQYLHNLPFRPNR